MRNRHCLSAKIRQSGNQSRTLRIQCRIGRSGSNVVFKTRFLGLDDCRYRCGIGSNVATLFYQTQNPAFTLPFVLVTWLILLICNNFYTDLLATPTPAIEHISDSLSDGFKSFGQVIFQSSLLSGILFFLAVFISSPIATLYGLAAAIISAILSFYLSIPINEINLGLYGFNAVLCAIVFAGTQVKDGVWVLISLVLSLVVSLLMLKIGVTKLTFPFVLATWITLFLKNRLEKSKATP